MERFEAFIRERQYLSNVTPATVEWYRRCLRWLPSENPTREGLKSVVLALRERGLTEAGCNTVLRCINAYLHWNSGIEGRCSAACSHPRVQQIKEPRKVMPTFTEQQIRRLIAWKPKTNQRRLHLLILMLFDTGCRISESLSVRVADIDLDNLLVRLDGKGRKERIVPISVELRKAVFRYIAEGLKPNDLVFGTRTGRMWSRRNANRDVKRLCKRLGFDAPARSLHSFRHTFAVSYLRRGGSVFHLQKVLGHSTLEMTRRYANLVTADLQAAHERVSLLSRR